MSKRLDLVGKKFGRLEVISDAGNDKYQNSQWLCKCDCGNEVVVKGYNLVYIHGTKSCGCLNRERIAERNKNKIVSEETKKKMSESHIGFKVLEITRQKISKNNKGKHSTHGLSKTRGYRNEKESARRANKRNQTTADANIDEILFVYELSSLMNEYGFGIKYEVDHIIPLSKGGLHHQDNLQILTAEANHKKNNKILEVD